ncbi:MAG: zinc finger domain-containing protein [Thaumarchaeota archaeon]|nr:zinc finger domain-containing protein [Nitrososphaerota archaeon]
MSQQSISLPSCVSCNRPIMPGERAAKFDCPNCHEVLLWRCQKCRKFSRAYACVNCAFEGP